MQEKLGKLGIKNKQGGFIRLIIFIIVLIFLMKYFHVGFSDFNNWLHIFFNWLKDFFQSLS